MGGAEHRPGQVRFGLPNFQQFEPGGTGSKRNDIEVKIRERRRNIDSPYFLHLGSSIMDIRARIREELHRYPSQTITTEPPINVYSADQIPTGISLPLNERLQYIEALLAVPTAIIGQETDGIPVTTEFLQKKIDPILTRFGLHLVPGQQGEEGKRINHQVDAYCQAYALRDTAHREQPVPLDSFPSYQAYGSITQAISQVSNRADITEIKRNYVFLSSHNYNVLCVYDQVYYALQASLVLADKNIDIRGISIADLVMHVENITRQTDFGLQVAVIPQKDGVQAVRGEPTPRDSERLPNVIDRLNFLRRSNNQQ